jgi:hypothetical protein
MLLYRVARESKVDGVRSSERHLGAMACLIGAIALAGCGDDPVTTPEGQPIVFTGQLRQGQREERPLVLAEEGTIRIEATKLSPVLVEAPEGEVPPLAMGVGIGDVVDGQCTITFGESLAEGDNLTVFVDDAVQCLLFFDNGTFPPDAIVAYTVTVEDVKTD